MAILKRSIAEDEAPRPINSASFLDLVAQSKPVDRPQQPEPAAT